MTYKNYPNPETNHDLNAAYEAEQAEDAGKTQQTKEWLKEQSQVLKAKCKIKAREIGYNTRDQFSDKLSTFEQACVAAGGTLSSKGENQAAEIVNSAANQINKTAQKLKDLEPEEIVDSVAEQIRDKPLLVLGASFIIGLAVSRIMSAAAPRETKKDNDEATIDSNINRARPPARNPQPMGGLK